MVIISSLPAWTSSSRMLSTPADFPFFSDCTAASTSLRRMGWSSSVSVWGQYWWISICLVIVQLSAVFCRSVQYLSFFCEAFSWRILDSSSFSLFHSDQVFHELVCPLTVVHPQIFFNFTTLLFYPVFFCLFHAPLDVVVHFLEFLRSFRFKSSLSQFSPFVAQIENFCGDQGFFLLLTMFVKDLTGCFTHCCVEGGDHWIMLHGTISHATCHYILCYISLYHILHVSTLGLFILYVYVFREYCLQLTMYSVCTQGVTERIINVHYNYYYYIHVTLSYATYHIIICYISFYDMLHVTLS